jgi:hypothetical protein
MVRCIEGRRCPIAVLAFLAALASLAAPLSA